MTLLPELPDSWESLLGLDMGDAVGRARQMLVIEGYREGRLSRGQAAEMLGLGFHEAEELFSRVGTAQQPTWDELELSGKYLRAIQGR